MFDSTASTVRNYEGRSSSYKEWALGSEAHEAKRVRGIFLKKLNDIATSVDVKSIVDVGCGPGRDLYEFSKFGHRVMGIDPSPTFCQLARDLMTNEKKDKWDVFEGDICDRGAVQQITNKFADRFDGAFCLASLFHIPHADLLPKALQNIKSLLKPGGLLLSTFPVIRTRDHHQEIVSSEMKSDGRWCTALSVEAHKSLLRNNGFRPLDNTDGEAEFMVQIYNGEWSCIISESI
jgi:SAM-dependent methyltransferase